MAASPEIVVRVERISKAFKLYKSPWHRLAETVARRPRHRQHLALKDVSFDVSRGEGFGIIGQNGVGKSTLLKLLAKVLQPTSGSLEVRGTVSSILELGAGFHPEFTGRQNIRINAAMLGLSARQVEEKTPAIIDFCELGDFLDQPVKVYSTGMSMRLAFAIATQVDPEVLIVDEALSVGDGYFQKKCSKRILELVDRGTTLLFCSHALYYVDAFCQRVLWLREGEMAALGPTREVVDRYESFLQLGAGPRDDSIEAAERDETCGGASSPARFREVLVAGEGRQAELGCGDTLVFELAWESDDPSLQFHLGVGVNREDDLEVFTLRTTESESARLTGQRQYRCQLEVSSLPLLKGVFDVYFFLLDETALHLYDRRVRRRGLKVKSDRYHFGVVRVDHRLRTTLDEPAVISGLRASVER